MRPIHQALILLAVAAITVGGLLALRRWNPEEKAMVAEQVEMVFHERPTWNSFTRIGSEDSAMGSGYCDIWEADFTVAGHRVHMKFIAYHDGGRVRMVPIG